MADSTMKRIREIKAQIAAQGGTDIDVEVGKHCKIRFRNPQGVPQMLVTSASPSDWRADRKNTTIIRRLMRKGPAYVYRGLER